jgi:hypothetical protein
MLKHIYDYYKTKYADLLSPNVLANHGRCGYTVKLGGTERIETPTA